jgi:hypothetical protein
MLNQLNVRKYKIRKSYTNKSKGKIIAAIKAKECVLKKKVLNKILATWEAEIGRISVASQPN